MIYHVSICTTGTANQQGILYPLPCISAGFIFLAFSFLLSTFYKTIFFSILIKFAGPRASISASPDKWGEENFLKK